MTVSRAESSLIRADSKAAAQLVAYFDRISEAPDAIPRLRRFILDLAVRGRLVAQDPRDEPASALLVRIGAERKRLFDEGEPKIRSAHEPVRRSDIPFHLPSSWEVVPMAWLARKFGAGSTPLGGKSVYQREGVPFLRSQNVHNQGLRLDDVALISRATHERMAGTHIQPNDVLLNITGASIGRCALVPSDFVEGNVSQHVAIIRLFLPDVRSFVHLSLTSPFFQNVIDEVQVGVSREGLSMQRLRRFPMLLPPLAEQHRIVAKVDELMALCDRLEAAQAERERRRNSVVAGCLQNLNGSAERRRFGRAARFHLCQLPQLAGRPEHIDELRETILDLAVRGLLTARNLTDESADAMLVRARRRRAPDNASPKGGRKEVAPTDLATGDVPFGWTIERLGNLVDPDKTISYGVLIPGPDVSDGIPFVRAQDLSITSPATRPNKRISPDIEKAYARTRLVGGEILLCVVGSIGKLGVAPASWAGANIARAIARIRPIPEISRDYLLIVLRGTRSQAYFTESTRTLAQPTLNVGLIERTPIPVPPLTEQNRIVAKVAEFMSLCDLLEAQLTTTQTQSRRLLEAVLHQALDDTPRTQSGSNDLS